MVRLKETLASDWCCRQSTLESSEEDRKEFMEGEEGGGVIRTLKERGEGARLPPSSCTTLQ